MSCNILAEVAAAAVNKMAVRDSTTGNIQCFHCHGWKDGADSSVPTNTRPLVAYFYERIKLLFSVWIMCRCLSGSWCHSVLEILIDAFIVIDVFNAC